MQNNPASLNQPGVITAATATGTAGVLVFALLPVFIGQIAEQFQLTEADAGLAASAYFVIYALVSLTAPAWIRRLNWRHIALAGYLVMFTGLLILLLAPSYTVALLAMAITGAGAATLLPISLTLVSDMLNTERVYAITISLEQLVPAILLIAISAGMLGVYGLQNTLQACMAVTLACVALSYALPTSGIRGGNPQSGESSSPVFALLSLFALALNFAAFAAMWAFFEILATQAGLSTTFSARWIAVGLLMTAAGPLLAAWLGNRAGRLWPLLLPTIAAAVGAIQLLGGVNETSYAIALVAFPLGYYVALSYALSIIADADPNGAYASLMSFALAIGAVTGPAFYGYLLQNDGPGLAFICALLFSGVALLALVHRNTSRIMHKNIVREI